MNGLVNLYKPRGMSSAAAVGKVKRILGEKRVGHMGTLDPMAEGVLVTGVGRSARLFDYLIHKRKAYVAKFKFGVTTDTLDAFGTVTEKGDIPSSDAALGAILSLVGKTDQIPPAYSAKHVNGERAYKLARDGRPPELKPVPVEIYSAELIAQPRPDEMVFGIECSAGTYIRSICRDVAKLCGSVAMLDFLQRTRSGKFDVKDSLSFEALEVRKAEALIPPDAALDLPRIDVPEKYGSDLEHGRAFPLETDGDALIYLDDMLYGIGRSENGLLRLKTYLKDG